MKVTKKQLQAMIKEELLKEGTLNSTWDEMSVIQFAQLAKKKNLLFTLFFDNLEIESTEAKELAEENMARQEELRTELKRFIQAYLPLRDLLRVITKNSPKY